MTHSFHIFRNHYTIKKMYEQCAHNLITVASFFSTHVDSGERGNPSNWDGFFSTEYCFLDNRTRHQHSIYLKLKGQGKIGMGLPVGDIITLLHVVNIQKYCDTNKLCIRAKSYMWHLGQAEKARPLMSCILTTLSFLISKGWNSYQEYSNTNTLIRGKLVIIMLGSWNSIFNMCHNCTNW